ncbi:MAG: ribosome silencing factor [Gemmatimonadota bacterium]
MSDILRPHPRAQEVVPYVREWMQSNEAERREAVFDLTEAAELARAVELAQERKGRDVVVLDLRGISSATDYFLIVSGTSDIHVRSVAEHIVEELKKDHVRPDHVEGLRGGRWVLIDYIDFVVHVFHPAVREFYQLERLWGDAPALVPDAQEL